MKIAALDIGGTAIKYGLFNENGNCLKFDKTPTNAHLGGAAVISAAENILSGLGEFDRIGVSTAGQVDPYQGKIIFATDNIPGYTGMEISKILSDKFNVPVAVENDVNSAALGEAHYGAAKEFDDFLCLTYGTGIGGCIIHNKEVYYGRNFSAGEFGHIITHAGGEKCTCGMNGCYERYASSSALCRMVEKRTGKYLNGREIFNIIKKDDNVRETVNIWMYEVATGLVCLIHIFNPSCIVLAGGIMNEKSVVEYLNEAVNKRVMPSYCGVKLTGPVLGEKSGLYGALYRVLGGKNDRGFTE